MADKANDLVISYTVDSQGNLGNYEPLQNALESGYRVVDMFTDATGAGGHSNQIGSVTVTVLLSAPSVEMVYQGGG